MQRAEFNELVNLMAKIWPKWEKSLEEIELFWKIFSPITLNEARAIVQDAAFENEFKPPRSFIRDKINKRPIAKVSGQTEMFIYNPISKYRRELVIVGGSEDNIAEDYINAAKRYLLKWNIADIDVCEFFFDRKLWMDRIYGPFSDNKAAG